MVKVTLLPLSGKNLDNTEPKMAFPLLSVATISCCTPPLIRHQEPFLDHQDLIISAEHNTCAAKTPFG